MEKIIFYSKILCLLWSLILICLFIYKLRGYILFKKSSEKKDN